MWRHSTSWPTRWTSFYLRTGKDDLFSHSEKFLWSASDFIAYYIKNERLRDVLAYMNPMYGGVAGHTPAYIHALINVLYINGQDRFVGSSQQLADALVDVITQGGGRSSQDNASRVCTSTANAAVRV